MRSRLEFEQSNRGMFVDLTFSTIIFSSMAGGCAHPGIVEIIAGRVD